MPKFKFTADVKTATHNTGTASGTVSAPTENQAKLVAHAAIAKTGKVAPVFTTNVQVTETD